MAKTKSEQVSSKRQKEDSSEQQYQRKQTYEEKGKNKNSRKNLNEEKPRLTFEQLKEEIKQIIKNFNNFKDES